MAEWLNAAVLKTVVPQGTVGSNPTSSATRLLRRSPERRFFILNAMTLRGILMAHLAFNRSGRPKASPSLFQASCTHQGPARCYVQLYEVQRLPKGANGPYKASSATSSAPRRLIPQRGFRGIEQKKSPGIRPMISGLPEPCVEPYQRFLHQIILNFLKADSGRAQPLPEKRRPSRRRAPAPSREQ